MSFVLNPHDITTSQTKFSATTILLDRLAISNVRLHETPTLLFDSKVTHLAASGASFKVAPAVLSLPSEQHEEMGRSGHESA